MTTNYEIKRNESYNSYEITFDGKPDTATRELLKSNGYRWHGVKALWYGYNDITEMLKGGAVKTETRQDKTKASEFYYNVKVGDIFYMSWGYDQTNNNFYKVVELVGNKSVRIVEVRPKAVSEKWYGAMARDFSADISPDNWEIKERSIFVKDQIKGDLHKLKDSFYNSEKANKIPILTVDGGYYTLHKYNGETLDESYYA